MNNSKQLDHLQAKIVNEAYTLYEAVASLIGEGTLKVANTSAQDYFKKVGEAAAQANLKGLPAICQHTIQNLDALSTLEDSKRQLLYGEIERWPKIILNYLHAPNNQNTCRHLIDYLKNAQWPQPYTKNQATELCESLSNDLKANVFSTNSPSKNNELNEGEKTSTTQESPIIDQSKNNLGSSQQVLHDNILEVSEKLSVALNQIITLEVENEGFIEGIEQYTDTVQSLWELSEELELRAFQDLFTFINDNVFASSEQVQSVRFQQLESLALWPKLLLEYLQSPEMATKDIEEFLFLESWPVSMLEIERTKFLRQLIQDCHSSFSIETVQLPDSESKEDKEDTSTLLALPPQSEYEDDDTALSTLAHSWELPVDDRDDDDKLDDELILDQKLIEVKDENEELILDQKLIEVKDEDEELILDQKLIEARDEDEELLFFKGNLLEKRQEQDELSLEEKNKKLIEELIEEMPEPDELLEEDELLKEKVDKLFLEEKDCVDELENKTDVETAEEAEELLFLEEKEDVNLEESIETEELSEKNEVQNQLSVSNEGSDEKDELEELIEEIDIEEIDKELPVKEKILSHPQFTLEPEISELLIGQINDVAEENTSCLNELIAADDETETLLMATMTYTENVQSVWEAAEMAGLIGLQEICTFINDNVMALGSQPKSSRENARESLLEWPTLMVAYLQKKADSVEALLSLMQITGFPMPLQNEEAYQLKQLLIGSARDVSAGEIPNIEVQHFESTQEKIDISQDEEGTEEGKVASTDILDENEIKDEIKLVAPDILELVCFQISDSSDGLSAALEVCVSMENDNPAFLEAIEEYTNRVQDIWDTAEMAGLSGLQEVCTFINDNLLAFSLEEQTTRVVAQKNFLEWPTKVLEYLHSPATGASSLVVFLQESGWPTPLEEETTENLLRLLKTPVGGLVEEPDETVTQEADDISVQTVAPLDVEYVEDNYKISLGNAEILEILSSELETYKEDFSIELNKFTTLESAELIDVTENYTEQVHRLYVASEMVGLEGLQTLCTFIIDNVKALSSEPINVRQKAKKVLEQWPDLVLAYLNSPCKNSVVPLVEHFRQLTWNSPLTEEAAFSLLNQLTAGSTAEEDVEGSEAHSRQTKATPEDVLLTIPEDIHQELLEAYLQEAPQNTQDFSVTIQKIIQFPESSEIKKAQRIAHTLKGSSNIIGIKGIANVAHHLEDTLEYLAKHQVAPPKELTDTLVEAADCMEMMVDALLGQDEAPSQAQQVLQSVLDWANRIDKGQLDAPLPQASAPEKTELEKTEPEKTEPVSKKPASSVAAGTPEQFLKVPTKTIDELMRLVGELSISVGQIQEKLKHVVHNTRTLTERDLMLQKKTFELENLVDVRGITGIENRNKEADKNKHFDSLEFEEYNELHSVAHSFIEFIADNRELAILMRQELSELETMFIHQERLNKDFQNNIMTTRMVPVSTILSKLQRNIRQTCRMTGKKSDLEVSGTDIMMDSDVLSNLADPLQHILRNAVDHGIEIPDERVLLGKPESGKIKLSFYREGNNIVVCCQDDGQGLNYTNIRYTAIQRGLITENKELTEQDLARLILTSGFSTKSGVTQVSGRGVGMDVVHTNIRLMKGTLDLSSETGKGTTILIKLPMTLVTVHVLLVRVGTRQFGIQTNHLEQAIAPGAGEFYRVGEEFTLKKGKNLYALKSLAKLLNMPDTAEITEEENRPLILVHEETGITAILVDELLDTHDLVMKTMGNYVTHIRGVTGASILGDGSLVPLLDLPELLRLPIQAAMPLATAKDQPENVVQATPHIMIVDDSLSVRKSLSLLVEDAGFETLLAKDGLEAIEVMSQTRPNVMLVDMEMPRMNGLELTAHVRANQNTQKMPIFMITSRTTEKHREQAEAVGVNAYLTKPYQENELLSLIDKALAGQV